MGALVLAAVTAPASAAPAGSVTTHRAPVIGAAKAGGPVIVWLTNQHSNLNLRTQGAKRTALAHADQKPVVAAIKAAGGTDIVQLVSVNAVAAHVSKAEVQHLRALAGVKKIVPDSTVTVGDPETSGPEATHAKTTLDKVAARAHAKVEAKNGSSSAADTPGVNPFPIVNDCGTKADPLIEPEALSDIKAPAMTNTGLATEPGHGVVVANDGISSPPNGSLVGNPNFIRPAADGGGSVVVGATPGDTTDSTDGEYYGDASSIDAQGTVEYDYSKELPYANLPANTCFFKLVGDAPGASLVDTNNIDTPENAAGNKTPNTLTESQIVAGIDAVTIKQHADVINESYGFANTPGSYATHYTANDAAVASGVTVVASSGDSGEQGTVSSPASDPMIIAAGATNTLRENAMAYGFTGWVNDDITPLSSGGTTPNNKVVDLVAPGYGGEAACNPNGSDCPTNTQTEAFGGTSQASPLIAGAAADVIQAFRDSHNGESPSPALVKQILTGTATDVDAPADQQGSGLLNIAAAIDAAKQQTNFTLPGTGTGASLIPSPTQLDLTGDGGSTNFQSVNLYNASNAATTVTGSYRTLGAEQQIGSTVTENVSAPDASVNVPVDGAQAAPDISFDVPAGVDRLDADMIWPEPTNSTILNFILTDPTGRLRQISYDYGAVASGNRAGTVPNIQHVELRNPEAGTWKVQIKWANGRSHLQEPPNIPGTYTGTVSFKVSGQNYVSTPASPPVTIAAHKSAMIPVQVAMPKAPGDHPQSVQFTSTGGAATSLPIARRTLVPATGGEFDTLITGSVGRGLGQISSYDVNVPAGQADLGVTVATPDTSANNPFTLYFVNPSGVSVATHFVGTRVTPGVPLTVANVNGVPMQVATYHVAAPAAGTWEIDVKLNLTTSGKEFQQTVIGDVLSQAPTITSPANAGTQTPTITGTGTPGRTITVSDAAGNVVCTTTVGTDGTWSCTASTQPGGPETLTATQADQTGFPSLPSNAVTITVPATATVSLSVDPTAPAIGQPVTLTATTTNVPDGTLATFYDGSSSLGTGTVTADSASLALPAGFARGDHQLTASVPATDSSLAATSPEVDITVNQTASTIALSLDKAKIAYGTPITGTVTVGGAKSGTVTVTAGEQRQVVKVSSAGTATFSLPAPAAGPVLVSASYSGTSNVAPSGPVTRLITVKRGSTTTSLDLSKSRVKQGKSENVTVKVSGSGPLYPSGEVDVTSTIKGKSTTTSATLTQGDKGTLRLSVSLPLGAGSVSVRAVYAGDDNYTSSKSPSETVTTY